MLKAKSYRLRERRGERKKEKIGYGERKDNRLYQESLAGGIENLLLVFEDYASGFFRGDVAYLLSGVAGCFLLWVAPLFTRIGLSR